MRLLMRMNDRSQGPAPVQAHRLQRRERWLSVREADHVHTKPRRAQEMLATSLGSITGSRDHDGSSPGAARTITRRRGVGKGFRRSLPVSRGRFPQAGGQAEPSRPREARCSMLRSFGLSPARGTHRAPILGYEVEVE